MIISIDSNKTLHYSVSRMAKGKPKKLTTSIRPTVEDLRLIDSLQAKTGLNTTGIIRLALRRLAEAEGVAA